MAATVSIRTMRDEFKVSLEPSQTVAGLKAEINTSKGYDVGIQKLVFSGKELLDDQTFGMIGVKDQDFILLLLARQKASPAEWTVESSPTARDPPNKGKGKEISPDVDLQDLQPGGSMPDKNPEDIVDIYSPQTSGLSSTTSTGGGGGGSWKSSFSSFSPSSFSPSFSPSSFSPSSFSPSSFTTPTTGFTPTTSAFSDSRPPARPTQPQPQPSSDHEDPLSAINTPDFKNFASMIRTNPAMREMLIDVASQQHPDLARRMREDPDMLNSVLSMVGSGSGSPFGDVDMNINMNMGGGGGIGMDGLARDEKEAVKRIIDMGFNEKRAIEAYIVSDKNEERAINFLLNSGHSQSQGASHQPTSNTPNSNSDDDDDDVDMARIMRDHPEIKQRLLAQIERDKPELAMMIHENPELFDAAFKASVASKSVQKVKICLTREEWEAVERMVDMGFSKRHAAEAYIACEKDEQRAVEFLISNPPEEEEVVDAKPQTKEPKVEAKAETGNKHLLMDCDPPITVQDMDALPATSGASPSSSSFKEPDAMDIEPDLGEGSSKSVMAFDPPPSKITQSFSSPNVTSERIQSPPPRPSSPSGGREVSKGTIILTQQEGEVIQSLMDFGFTEHQAVEAYLVSEKDPQRAMNYLLDNFQS